MKQYYAQNGLIKDMYIFISFRAIKYDTRAFLRKSFSMMIKGLNILKNQINWLN